MQPSGSPRQPSAVSGGALAELREDASSRKRFLRMVGGGGAVAALGTLLAACGDDDSDDTAATTTGTGTTATVEDRGTAAGDLEIVNFALTLEFLEADFYRQVVEAGIIEDRAVADIAKKFGETEQAHVDALTQTARQLGGEPAAQPETNFQEVLAGGVDMVLETAATIENVGAAAYLGQAGRIKDKEILAAALSIHSVEARHAAALNQLVGRGFQGGENNLEGSIPDGAFAEPLDMDAVLEQIQPFLA